MKPHTVSTFTNNGKGVESFGTPVVCIDKKEFWFCLIG